MLEANTRLRVLSISDNELYRETLSSTLTMYGCTAIDCGDFSVALSKILEFSPHLVICGKQVCDTPAHKFIFTLMNNAERGTIERPYILVLGDTLSRNDIALLEEFGANQATTIPVELGFLVQTTQFARHHCDKNWKSANGAAKKGS